MWSEFVVHRAIFPKTGIHFSGSRSMGLDYATACAAQVEAMNSRCVGMVETP